MNLDGARSQERAPSWHLCSIDTLDAWSDADAGTPIGKTVVRQPGPLPKFVGGSCCSPAYYARRRPATLTAY